MRGARLRAGLRMNTVLNQVMSAPANEIILLVTVRASGQRLRSNGVAGTQTNLAWETLFDLSATRPGPLHIRLRAAIRRAIRDGRLPLGAALPPSRTLATDLGVSRWTVTQAYSLLIAEGYLAGQTGSATRVSWSPDPGEDRAVRPVRPSEMPPRSARFDLSPGRPDLRAFPRRKWAEAIRTAAETAPFDQLDYSQSGGHPRLRAVLADHLNRSREAAAEASTISIFAGAGQSMSQLSHALLAAGHAAIGMEDPGSSRLLQAARTVGLELVRLPVDDEGMVVEELVKHPGLRAVCVGAARQVAVGCTLAPQRRAALVKWARRVDGLIVEDDYDSEFSYRRPALPAMQGMDRERVALLGSMNRTLGPTVNIGWVVAPSRWVEAVRAAREIPVMPSALNQLALAHFMESGDYHRHLRATRRRFRARRAALMDALERRLPGFRTHGTDAGLDLLLELPPGSDAAAIIVQAQQRDMQLCNLDDLRFRPDPGQPGLLLGYGNLNDSVIEQAVAVLAEVITQDC
jgi:GntR family transcriptional regulator / MocR family aminotransferase